MEFRLHDHGQITDEVRAIVEHKAQLFERRLEDIAEDLKALDATVEYRHRDDTYIAKLVLAIPDRTLAARGEGPTAEGALGRAFDDLGDELDEALAKRRGEPRIRRQQLAWRLPSAQLAAEEAEIEELEAEEEEAEELDQLAEEFATPATPGQGQ
jgi:ribosome-associated translation inhibitor RaiA